MFMPLGSSLQIRFPRPRSLGKSLSDVLQASKARLKYHEMEEKKSGLGFLNKATVSKTAYATNKKG